jgi:hypothetical protein
VTRSGERVRQMADEDLRALVRGKRAGGDHGDAAPRTEARAGRGVALFGAS